MPETMSRREAFKFGFLLKCAELGLDAAGTRAFVDEAIEKIAADGIGIWGKGKDLLTGLQHLGGWGLAAGVGAGAGTGYLAARMTEPDVDAEEYKKMELIAALRQHAAQANRSAQRLLLRTAAPSVRSPQLMGAH
jgi:hypothetical protein